MSLEVIKFMVKENPSLREQIQDFFVTEKELTKKQKKTIKQQAIFSASMTWMPQTIN